MNRNTERLVSFLIVIIITFFPLACSSDNQTENNFEAEVETATENKISTFPEYTLADRQKQWCLIWYGTDKDGEVHKTPRKAIMDKLNEGSLVFRYIVDNDTILIESRRTSNSEIVKYEGHWLYGNPNLRKALEEETHVEITMIDKYSFTGPVSIKKSEAKIELYATDGSCW